MKKTVLGVGAAVVALALVVGGIFYMEKISLRRACQADNILLITRVAVKEVISPFCMSKALGNVIAYKKCMNKFIQDLKVRSLKRSGNVCVAEIMNSKGTGFTIKYSIRDGRIQIIDSAFTME
ncbi:MAG: hypothetical protein GXO44_01700 [Deferribacteres bacterium]|nr:hypothetical protein [Deferribacteres bacterium]